MDMKDKLMWAITLGILGFIGLVVIGEYSSMLMQQATSGEKFGTNSDAIALVQNALVGLIGIIGGYFAGKGTKDGDK
jgi:putative exporter of polyketide antibiotics